MAIKSKAEYANLDTPVFINKCFCFVALFFQVILFAIEEKNFLFIYVQWMKQLPVEVVPATALRLLIHSCPFIEADKFPPGNICSFFFNPFFQYFKQT